MSESSDRYLNLIDSIGKPAVSALFPDDFEVYIMSLELVDSVGDTVEYFSFPVLPTQITKTEPEVTNIKKTAKGTVVLTTPTFIPQDINLTGNFGRSFKILVGTNIVNFKAFANDLSTANGVRAINPFDSTVKTGYGCTKILQRITRKSVTLDKHNQPYKLFFHNPTLGESHMVEKVNLSLTQNSSTSNVMWGYNLSLKTIAPSDQVRTAGKVNSLRKSLLMGTLQKGVNILGENVGSLIKNGATKVENQVLKGVKKKIADSGNKFST